MKNGKEEKILKAAEKVFVKKGFFPTRIEDIAETANIAKGTVYLYFPDKTSIYVALLEKHLSEGIDLIETIKREKSKAMNKLERIFDEGFELVSHVKGMIPLVSIENINLTAEIMKAIKVKIQPKMKQTIDSLAEIIQAGIDKKEIKKIDAKLGAFIILDLIRACSFIQDFAPNPEEHRGKIKELFFYGIKGKK